MQQPGVQFVDGWALTSCRQVDVAIVYLYIAMMEDLVWFLVPDPCGQTRHLKAAQASICDQLCVPARRSPCWLWALLLRLQFLLRIAVSLLERSRTSRGLLRQEAWLMIYGTISRMLRRALLARSETIIHSQDCRLTQLQGILVLLKGIAVFGDGAFVSVATELCKLAKVPR